MLGRTLAVTRKEFLHILRDRRTLVVIGLIPIVQMVLLGYAATNDIEHLRLAILDSDETAASRALVDAYRATGYFEIESELYANNHSELATLIDSGDARAGLIIPSGYSAELASGRSVQVGVVVDGSDPTVATTVYSASQAVGQEQSLQLALKTMGLDSLPGAQIEVRPRVWYNPQLRSANFMIPALMGIVLQFLATLLTALAIVRERELGTLEQLIVTPVRSLELVIGKVTPYVAVAFVVLLEVIVVGVVWFDVPIHGSITLLLTLSALFLVTSLSMGILISTLANTQQEAMLLTWFILLPAIFLSGFFFPLDAMPGFLRALSLGVPLRYLLTIMRSIVLKGVGIEMLWQQVAALILFAVLILIAAALRFRKHLE